MLCVRVRKRVLTVRGLVRACLREFTGMYSLPLTGIILIAAGWPAKVPGVHFRKSQCQHEFILSYTNTNKSSWSHEAMEN